MIDCAINGDSIAVGLAPYFPQCKTSHFNPKVGATSSYVLSHVIGATLIGISVGSNDPNSRRLRANLLAIRAKSRYAIWVIPHNKRAARIVRSVAKQYGDKVVVFRAGKDGIH